tara:strand:+ start:10709 stop:11722 length:1014 start_codon:yes stop_codon:yes gene_type:complete
MSYDVYYSTGGGSMVYGGSDVWVNYWLENVAPKLDHPSKLLIHRRRPDGFKVNFSSPIEILWQGDDQELFNKYMNECRRLHILHGYYTPHKLITQNQDKLKSVVIHVSVELSLKAGFQLNVPKLKHYSANPQWETRVTEMADKVIWIGLKDVPLHDRVKDVINIPNFYEFKNNLMCNNSNKVGFAARCETRKAPHFLDGIESYAFTDVYDWRWWKANYKCLFEKTRLYQFNYRHLDRFYRRQDWGISHSCHLNEPFGYSIFQAFDYGKLPILQMDWLKDFEYPFRAFTKEQFKQQVDNISQLSVQERNDYLNGFREHLRQWDNKKEWTDKYLEIYNS